MTLYIQLQGGLGNQLFQYAAAQRMGPATILIKALPAHSGRDYRSTLYIRCRSVDAAPPGTPILPLKSFSVWAPESYQISHDSVLEGYFQYLPAINSLLPQIRHDLITFLAPYRETIRSTYGIRAPSDVGFLHVRRGDYLTAPPNLHWIIGPEYYKAALAKGDALRWLVISDDVAWCREQEVFRAPTIEVVDEPDELAGLALMSLCHGGAILANSTYSWWGAMLGAEPAGAPVTYPAKWFSDDVPNLFPSRWTRL